MACLGPNCLFVAPIVAILLYAAYTDLRFLKIRNVTTGVVLAMALVFIGSCSPMSVWHWHLLSGFMVFAVGTVLFHFGAFGGGDVKLWSATAFLFTPALLMQQIIAVTIVGFVLALFLMGTRIVMRMTTSTAAPTGGSAEGQDMTFAKNRAVLPYGVAISLGTIYALLIKSPAGEGGLTSLGL